MKSNKSKKAGSFFSLLARHYLLLTLGMLVVIGTIYGLLLFEINHLAATQYPFAIFDDEAFKKDDFSALNVKKFLGQDGSLLIFDGGGELIFEKGAPAPEDLQWADLNLAPDISGDVGSVYYIQRFGDGEKRQILVVREEYADYESYFDVISRDNAAGYNEYKDFALLDEELNITSGNLFPDRESLSEQELALMSGQISDGRYIYKYEYQNLSGNQRTALMLFNFSDVKLLDTLYGILENLWIIFVAAYVIMLVLSMLWLSRKTKAFLKPLNDSIVNFSDEGKEYSTEQYKGPNEFVEIAENFAALSQKLGESERERRALDEGRMKLIADISHDLKTPITVIQGYSKAICDGIVPEKEQKRYLETIYKKSDGLVELINKFSEFCKLDHPEFPLQARQADIAEFCKAYMADKYSELELAGFEISIHIPEKRINAVFDEIQLTRAFDNIVGNSMKYNAPGTAVLFNMTEGGGKIIITIGDDGIGISEALKNTVFEPFVVADEARSSGQGTGLGLAITKKIIEAHGGEITLKYPPTAPYKTEFIISLPQ